MRPIIRPGLQLLRRDVHSVQLGRAWPGSTCVHDGPVLRAVLDAIDGFRDVTAVVLTAAATGLPVDSCSATLDALIDIGAVVDRSATRRPGCPEALWSSLWLMAGPDSTAGDLLGRRAASPVFIHGDGLVAAAIRDVLPRGHVPLAERPAAAAVAVMAFDCEPDREHSDTALRAGVPHVWAFLRDLVGVIGPFVDPGESACLRCVDLARGEVDRAWPTTVSGPRPVVPPVDPLLAASVGAMVAAEIGVWASGRQPQTVGAVIELPYGAGAVERCTHAPHPHCGCGWAAEHVTLGA